METPPHTHTHTHTQHLHYSERDFGKISLWNSLQNSCCLQCQKKPTVVPLQAWSRRGPWLCVCVCVCVCVRARACVCVEELSIPFLFVIVNSPSKISDLALIVFPYASLKQWEVNWLVKWLNDWLDKWNRLTNLRSTVLRPRLGGRKGTTNKVDRRGRYFDICFMKQ